MKISIFKQEVNNSLWHTQENYIRMLCMKNQPILITTAWKNLAALKRCEGQKSEKSEKTFLLGEYVYDTLFLCNLYL